MPVNPLVLISGLPHGGAERVTVSFLTHLARRGRPVAACTVTGRHDGALAQELREAGVPRWDLGARRLADAAAFARYLSVLRRGRFDLVHAHGQDAWILAAAARPIARVPLVLTRHVLEEPEADWRQRLRARAALCAARRAEAVVAVSSCAAQRLAELSGRPRSSVRVIHNGIDLERFQRADLAGRRDDIRGALGYGPEARLVLVVAVLRAGKGHETTLAAFDRIRRQVNGVALLFAGGGIRETELRRQAEPFGKAVRFLGDRQDIPELLAAADLVVLASQAEALPTALMEAGAAGRPVVATRVGGTPDVVEDGVTGFLVPPESPGDLADAVTAVLTQPERAAALGTAGARLAASRFSLETHIEATFSLWREVLQSRA